MYLTPSRRRARQLKAEAERFEGEAAILQKIDKMQPAANLRLQTAAEYRARAELLEKQARLEDLSVRKVALRKGKRTYCRWIASWREGAKIRTVYLGSCNKITRERALEKARKMKAQALGLEL